MSVQTIDIKESVKDAYTKAVEKTAGGCCGSSAIGELTQKMKGNLVKMAGYSEEELNQIPQDAVENSFGCGNPLAFAGVKEGDVVLDIGSGAGIDCLIAAEKVGESGKVIGIDMTPKMIEKAKDNARRAGVSNVEFRLGDADNMPVDDASVDWIISNCVINLAPDKDEVFRETYRVLKPGGRVSISDIVLGKALPEAVRNSVEALVGCVAGALEEDVYLQKMRDAGLADVEVTERIVYDSSQIKGLVDSECGCGNLDEMIGSYVKQFEGQIWSAKIFARRPE